MADYHRPDAKKLQTLKDIANKLRIHSINATTASNSGYDAELNIIGLNFIRELVIGMSDQLFFFKRSTCVVVQIKGLFKTNTMGHKLAL